jgi:hypothetical protein
MSERERSLAWKRLSLPESSPLVHGNPFVSVAKTFVRLLGTISFSKIIIQFTGIVPVTPDPGSWSGAGFDPGSRFWIPAFSGMTRKRTLSLVIAISRHSGGFHPHGNGQISHYSRETLPKTNQVYNLLKNLT